VAAPLAERHIHFKPTNTMYIRKPFEITDRTEIDAFIEANAFGQLISLSEGRLLSTHLPFLLSEDKTTLLGHLALQNPQASDIQNQEVLVTLQGAHNYISPTWYLTPGVPTWNYQAVHIYGRCTLFDDTEVLRDLVDALTSRYESELPTQWNPEYSSGMLKAIVGIEIAMNEVQCQYKLNQNRSTQDQQHVINQLESNGSHQLAKAMRANQK